MKLDHLIAHLIDIRTANPATGDMDVLLERDANGPAPIAYVSANNADGDGPVDPKGPEATHIYLALLSSF
ncbi:hypothetical protein ACOI1H_23200 [Loktanella sp. DJP18]|uniref:hypothetical protein n=1 Tax=Loktanella sp. DJP18 TaxID=3409788 RepID=UPI003BB62A67